MPQKPAGEIEEADKRARAEVSGEDGNETGMNASEQKEIKQGSGAQNNGP